MSKYNEKQRDPAASAPDLGRAPDEKWHAALFTGGVLSPAASNCLGRILLRVRPAADAAPIIVCTPCGYGEDAREVAAAIAGAAAHSVGRTLFIAPREDDGRDILPDAFIPGLFHNNIGIPELVIPTASERPLLPSHAPDGQPFRIIVLAVSSPDRAGAAIAGGGGAGAVLVVHEDKTTLASIRRTQADLQAAGGTVWGTILAKAIRPAAQSARRSWWH